MSPSTPRSLSSDTSCAGPSSAPNSKEGERHTREREWGIGVPGTGRACGCYTAMEKKEEELPRSQLSQRLRWSCTSAPHMGSASWEHPWEGWGEGHALPRSSPRKKQWHKSISRVINHPERGYGGCNCLWEKQNPAQSCQELAPAGSRCGPGPAPSGMVIHGQGPSRELRASAQP